METLPREKLAEILTQYGRSVCDDPRRCEALLKDLCGQNKREISALMGALKERVPAELLAAEAGLPKSALIARLSGRLHTDLAFTEEAARWAVESWALALGVVTIDEIEAARPAPAPAACSCSRQHAPCPASRCTQSRAGQELAPSRPTSRSPARAAS